MKRVARIVFSFALLVAGCVWAVGGTAHAQEFRLQVGPPVAASPQPGSTERKVMAAVLAVRPFGCTDPATARILATAEGMVNGVRRSLPLNLQTTSVPGVHIVPKTWTQGAWVVRLVGRCGDAAAGAVVTLEPSGAYRRDGVEYVAGEPSTAQVDRALQDVVGAQAAVAAAR